MKLFSTRVRVSAFTYVLLALCAVQVACAVLALLLPWGSTADGKEIRTSLVGLLPWFLIVPILLQLGFLAVSSRFLQGVYLILNFLLGAFVIGVQFLASLKYESGLEAGFYMVFAGASVTVIAGILCIVERRAFPGLREKGKARILPEKKLPVEGGQDASQA